MQYTKEEKKAYFKSLRDQWQACKVASEQDEDARAKWQAVQEQAGGKISYTGFYFTLSAMRSQNIAGLPYVDAKTYKKWQEQGFTVRKGEKSTISGISWIKAEKADANNADANDGFLFPKEYHLFHAGQVEAIAE